MARTVTVIPATVNPITRMLSLTVRKRRVAGYARVSTDKDEQFSSYEAQIDYYTNYIQTHSDWEYVKVYTDEGISGTSTKNREGFNAMLRDSYAGKIDLIITKSVSRFARNTVDSLTTIRKLKEIGTECYFEKENIWTFDSKGELLITIMSSLAQEESRSISENVKWGHRKRFSDGKLNLPYKNFLGYDRGEDKDSPPVVNREQAKVVRRIYSMFMHGQTQGMIAKILTDEGIPTPAGKSDWSRGTVERILSNEKYKGSALLQKKFTVDFLTKKCKKNEGEVPQYYVENSHEAIIDPIEWDAVQDEIERRKSIGRAYSGKSVLGAKIVCGDCGCWYGRKVWHSTDKYKSVIWQCNNKFSREKAVCKTPHITEDEIKEKFLEVYNGMIQDREKIIRSCSIALRTITDTTAVDEQINQLKEKIAEITAQNDGLMHNPESAMQEDFSDRCKKLMEKYEECHAELVTLEGEKGKKLAKRKQIERFIAVLVKNDKLLTEFDECLWLTVVDMVIVKQDGKFEFVFFDGNRVDG